MLRLTVLCIFVLFREGAATCKGRKYFVQTPLHGPSKVTGDYIWIGPNRCMTYSGGRAYCAGFGASMARLPTYNYDLFHDEVGFLSRYADEHGAKRVRMDYRDNEKNIIGFNDDSPLSLYSLKRKWEDSDGGYLETNKARGWFAFLQPSEFIWPERCLSLCGFSGWKIHDCFCEHFLLPVMCRIPGDKVKCKRYGSSEIDGGRSTYPYTKKIKFDEKGRIVLTIDKTKATDDTNNILEVYLINSDGTESKLSLEMDLLTDATEAYVGDSSKGNSGWAWGTRKQLDGYAANDLPDEFDIVFDVDPKRRNSVKLPGFDAQYQDGGKVQVTDLYVKSGPVKSVKVSSCEEFEFVK